MDLDSVADELYGLDPDQFTAARTEREQQARAAGDRDLAAQIRALRKPTTVAWLANLLVRNRPDEVQPLLELGAGLREAQSALAGAELRRLSRQRRQLVYAVVQQARALARETGHQVSDDVARGLEQTLEAALADPDAEAALRAGRLVRGLEYTGFGPGGGAGAAPAAAGPAGTPAAKPAAGARPAGARSGPGPADPDRDAAAAERRRREQVDRARHDLAEARSLADAAAAAEAEAVRATQDTDRRRQETEERAQRLRDEFDRADQEAMALARETRTLRRAQEQAERATRQARRRVENAAAKLAGLEG